MQSCQQNDSKPCSSDRVGYRSSRSSGSSARSGPSHCYGSFHFIASTFRQGCLDIFEHGVPIVSDLISIGSIIRIETVCPFPLAGHAVMIAVSWERGALQFRPAANITLRRDNTVVAESSRAMADLFDDARVNRIAFGHCGTCVFKNSLVRLFGRLLALLPPGSPRGSDPQAPSGTPRCPRPRRR